MVEPNMRPSRVRLAAVAERPSPPAPTAQGAPARFDGWVVPLATVAAALFVLASCGPWFAVTLPSDFGSASAQYFYADAGIAALGQALRVTFAWFPVDGLAAIWPALVVVGLLACPFLGLRTNSLVTRIATGVYTLWAALMLALVIGATRAVATMEALSPTHATTITGWRIEWGLVLAYLALVLALPSAMLLARRAWLQRREAPAERADHFPFYALLGAALLTLGIVLWSVVALLLPWLPDACLSLVSGGVATSCGDGTSGLAAGLAHISPNAHINAVAAASVLSRIAAVGAILCVFAAWQRAATYGRVIWIGLWLALATATLFLMPDGMPMGLTVLRGALLLGWMGLVPLVCAAVFRGRG